MSELAVPPLPAFRLALAQMLVQPGELDANVERAQLLIAEAAGQDARLVVLPEALDCGWSDPSASRLAASVPDGATCRRLRDAAARHGIFVCAGLSERDGEKIYNTAVLIDPSGKVIARHRKINGLSIEHDCYAQGNRLAVVDTELGAIGLMICADAFARDRVLSRSLGYMGADIIVSPCAWAVPADYNQAATPYGELWIDAYRPVAREFHIWIAAASCVGSIQSGPWAGRKCIGSSMVIGPNGDERLRAPFGDDAETVTCTEVAPVPRPARGCGWLGNDGKGQGAVT